MQSTEIVPFERRHMDSVTESLILAFWDDPFAIYFAPDPNKRRKVLTWMWRSALSYASRWGVTHTDPTGRSAAIWLPPGGTSIPMRRMIRTSFIRAPFVLGLRGMTRFSAMDSITRKAHKRQAPDPHWYLMTLGVHPDLQGQGIGSALIRVVHDRADAAGQLCYLETATEADVAFYSKRGYEVGESLQTGTLSGASMIRRPVSASPASTA